MVLHGFAQGLYVITQQKRNSKPVAALIIPTAVADSGKFYISHDCPAFESHFFPSCLSVSVFYLPPHKEKGMSAHSRIEDTVLSKTRVAPRKPGRFRSQKVLAVGVPVPPGHVCASALQMLSLLCMR